MSAVLYARIPDPLKEALEAYAGRRGLTKTRAAVELLEQALQADAGERSLSQLEGKLERSRGELARTQASLREAELELRAAREREQLTARTYTALAARARQELARCPGCREPVSGSDLLVAGRCPNPICKRALTELLAPAPRAGLNQIEYLALLGALGLLTGLALASAGEGGD